MPQPLPYSENTMKNFFSQANSSIYSSKGFKPVADAFKALQDAKAERENNINNGTVYSMAEESSYQKKMKTLYRNLKNAADAYAAYKGQKEEKDRSVQEEARFCAAKSLSAFADVNAKNCDEYARNLDVFENLKSALKTADNEAAKRYADERKAIRNYEIKKIEEDTENISFTHPKGKKVYVDKITNKTYVHSTNKYKLSEYSDKMLQLMQRYKPLVANHPNDIVPAGEDDFSRFENLIEVYKNAAKTLENVSDPLILAEANNILNGADLKAAITYRIKKYNFKINNMNYGERKAPQTIDIPNKDSEKDFFDELAENIKDNPDTKVVSQIIDAYKGMKAVLSQQQAALNKANNTKIITLKTAMKDLAEHQEELDLIIETLKFEELLKDDSLKQEKVMLKEGFTPIPGLKFTREKNGRKYTAEIKEKDIGKFYSMSIKPWLRNYKPDAAKFIEKLPASYNPLEAGPGIIRASELYSARLDTNPNNRKLLNEMKAVFNGAEEYLRQAAKYLNTVSRNSIKDAKLIVLPDKKNMNGKNFFEELEKAAADVPGANKLTEVAKAMIQLKAKADPLIARSTQIEEYTDLLKTFVNDVDKSKFPSPQYKEMKTQLMKLKFASALPDSAERQKAFQTVYDRACDYLMFKDPAINGKPGSKLKNEYERTRVDFAKSLRNHCIKYGADPLAYHKEVFEHYDKSEELGSRVKAEENKALNQSNNGRFFG